MKLAIIDDEKRIRSFLRSLIKSTMAHVELVGEADSVESGKQLIENLQPEVVLLDVELGDGTAFDLLAQVSGQLPIVIFVTAFEHHALKAFRANAADYVVKPVDPADLFDALEKARTRLELKSMRNDSSIKELIKTRAAESDRIAIPSGFSHIYVDASEIVYIMADGAYCKLTLEKGQQPITVSKTLKNVEQSISHLDFVRVHRSYLVNMAKIVEFNRSDGGYIKMSNGERISFSKQFRNEAIELLSARSTYL